MRRFLTQLVFGVSLLALPMLSGRAHAHITMTFPTPRSSAQKQEPCGATGSVRGTTAAVFRPGETITVTWNETVDHTAHYRIAFDADGDDDFVSPSGRDDVYNSAAVLVDMIADRSGGSYTQEITLPDTECERCTIQLIQVMYGAGNYFQCADIAIRSDAPGTDGGVAMMGGDGGASGEDGGGLVGRDGGSVMTGDGGGRPRTDGGSLDPGVTTGSCGCRVAAASASASAWASAWAPVWGLLLGGATLVRSRTRRARRGR